MDVLIPTLLLCSGELAAMSFYCMSLSSFAAEVNSSSEQSLVFAELSISFQHLKFSAWSP